MARSRDISKVLSSNTTLATDAEVAASYQTKATAGLTLLTPTSIANTGGTASIGTNGTVSFSGASTVSLNGVFSATYTNYRVHFNITASANDVLRFRLRNGGTDRSGATDYIQMTSGIDTAGAASNIVGATSSWNVGKSFTTITTGLFTVYEPFSSGYTSMSGEMIGINAANTTIVNYRPAGQSQVSQSNDGFSLFPASGTISGSISVFGVNK